MFTIIHLALRARKIGALMGRGRFRPGHRPRPGFCGIIGTVAVLARGGFDLRGACVRMRRLGLHHRRSRSRVSLISCRLPLIALTFVGPSSVL